MVFEWNCGCLHLPQSALFNAVSDFGMPNSLGILGRGCLNYGDAKITVTPGFQNGGLSISYPDLFGLNDTRTKVVFVWARHATPPPPAPR